MNCRYRGTIHLAVLIVFFFLGSQTVRAQFLPQKEALTLSHPEKVTGFIQVKNETHKTPALTLSALILLDSPERPQTLISNFEGGGMRLAISSQRLKMTVATSKGNIGSSIRVGLLLPKKIYHYVATYDGKYLKTYLNGELVNQVAGTGSIIYKRKNPLCLGAEATATACKNDDFSGVIENVFLWKQALTSAEVGLLASSYANQAKFDNLNSGLIKKWDYSRRADYKPQKNLNLLREGAASPVQDFRGTSYLQVQAEKNISPDSITLSTVVKFTSLNRFQYIASKIHHGGGYGLYLTEHNLRFQINTSQGKKLLSYPVRHLEKDRWYHIVGTYDGQKAVLYVDGIPLREQKHTGALVYSYKNNNFCLGTDIGVTNCVFKPANLFRGQMGEVAVWSRALSHNEIQNLMASYTTQFQNLACRDTATSTPFKVMTYNIYKARARAPGAATPLSLAQEEKNLLALAKVIKAESPDILVLNEANHIVPVANARGNDLIQQHAMYLGDKLGYPYVVMFTKSRVLFRNTPRTGNSNTGSAILSKFPFVAGTEKRYTLPRAENLKDSVRIVGKIQIEVGQGRQPLDVFVTHMSVMSGQERELQANYIHNNILKESKAPRILAGDFNADPYRSIWDQKVFDIFRKTLAVKNFKKDMSRTTRTSSSDIDHILYSSHGKTVLLGTDYISVNETEASDHRPVKIKLCLRKMEG